MTAASLSRRFLGGAAVVGVVAAIAFGGGEGLLFAVGLALLALITRFSGPTQLHRVGSRLTHVGSMVLVVGIAAAVFGVLPLVALVVVAVVLDVYVGRRRLAGVTIEASAPQDVLAGDETDIDLRVSGVTWPVFVTPHAPRSRGGVWSGAMYQVTRDGSGIVRHRWYLRAVHESVFVELSTSGWLLTAITTRTDVVPLDSPVHVHPRAVRVDVPVVPEARIGDETGGSARSRRGPQTDEIRALRPYLPGDSRRRIHWPTTARRGELAVVEVEGEVQEAVHVAVELPGVPCDLPHEGTHAEHLDVVAGQARFTVDELSRRGIPVVLTTLEVQAAKEPATVTAAVRNPTELGRRLAAATPGSLEPSPTSADLWKLGPAAGPACPATHNGEGGLEARTAPGEDPPAWTVFSAEGCTPPAARTSSASDPSEPAERLQGLVRRLGLVGRVSAVAAVVLGLLIIPDVSDGSALASSAGAGLAVMLLVPSAIAIVLVLRPLSRRDGAMFATMCALYLTALGAGAGGRPLQTVVVVCGVAVFCLSRLMALDIAGQLGAESEVWRMDRRVVGCNVVAVVLVVVAATLAVGAAFVGILIALALVPCCLAWSNRPTWWVVALAVSSAGMLLALLSSPSTLLSLGIAVASAAVLVTTEESSRQVQTLDGSPPSWSLAAIAVKTVAVAVLITLLLPALDAARGAIEDSFGVTSHAVIDGRPDRPLVDENLGLRQPRPNSRRVVLTVQADRPSLLRLQSLDEWDGEWWSRDHDDPGWTPPDLLDAADRRTASTLRVGTANQRVQTASGASGDLGTFVQRVTVHARYAAVLPATAEPVSAGSGARIVDYADGSRRVVGWVSRGESYTVVSRPVEARADELRAASQQTVPKDILDRYAQPPPLSARTIEAIDEIAAGLPTAYDQARALEAWLAEQVDYSLEAPLPPPGTDVVDHFLFESRLGWCQQISTTLALALRHLGVPARVAVGYVANEWDGRQYVVRERHYHAWAEVYFPGVGWYAFDPSVSLDADEAADPFDVQAVLDVLARAWLPLTIAIVLALAGLGLRNLLGRKRMRRSEAATSDPRPWASASALRVRDLAQRCGFDRGPHEGVAHDAADVAQFVGDDRIHAVARLVERDAYGPTPTPERERQAADALLGEIEFAVDERLEQGAVVAGRRTRAWTASDPTRPPEPPGGRRGADVSGSS